MTTGKWRRREYKNYTRRGLTAAPSTYGVIDQLTYSYGDAARPDLLTDVQDAGSTTKGFKDATSPGTNYTYDLNGNLTLNKNKVSWSATSTPGNFGV